MRDKLILAALIPLAIVALAVIAILRPRQYVDEHGATWIYDYAFAGRAL